MGGTMLETTAEYLDSDLSDFELQGAYDVYRPNDVQPIYKLERGQNVYGVNTPIGTHPNFYRHDKNYGKDTTYAENIYDISPRFGREEIEHFTGPRARQDFIGIDQNGFAYGKDEKFNIMGQRNSDLYEKNGFVDIYKRMYDTSKGSDTEVSVENIGYENAYVYDNDNRENLPTINGYDTKNEFRWWCDEQNVDYSELTSESTPGYEAVAYDEWPQRTTNADVSTNTYVCEDRPAKVVGNKDSSRSLERTNSGSLSTNDSLSMETQYGDLGQDEKKEEFPDVAPASDRHIDAEPDWKSFIMPGNQVDELRTLILSRLGVKRLGRDLRGRNLNTVNPLETFDVSTNTLETNLTFDALEQEILWLRSLNSSLKDKLLYILKNNGGLQYDVSQKYVESVQRHLIKVHEQIDRLVLQSSAYDRRRQPEGVVNIGDYPTDGPSNANPEDSLKETTQQPPKDGSASGPSEKATNETSQDSSDPSTPTDSAGNGDVEPLLAENAKIKEQNEELKRRLEELGRKYDESVKRERFLADRLMKAEVSKNALQEEFNKSVAYLRSTKEKLKNLADSKKRQGANNLPHASDMRANPVPPPPIYNQMEEYVQRLSRGAPTTLPGSNMAATHPRFGSFNGAQPSNQAYPMRSNTAVPKVKFAEESDIYFLPQRSASECGPIIVKPDKRSKFSQIFNFMDGFFNKQGRTNFTPNEQIALYKAHLMNRGIA